MSTEIELKLSLAPEDCVHLLQLPLLDSLSISPAETHELYTIYYDTPQLDLKHNRIALRLRRINGRWLVRAIFNRWCRAAIFRFKPKLQHAR
mgnify:CR=1 FL=1